MTDNPWTEDQNKGIQGIRIVESPAHFDLSAADVAAARRQGLEITSIRAFHAHADNRLHETQPVIPDSQARALLQRLTTAWPHLPTSANPRLSPCPWEKHHLNHLGWSAVISSGRRDIDA